MINICIYICLGLFGSIPPVMMAILSFIARKNYINSICDTGFIHLSNWLVINSTINLIILGISVILISLIVSNHKKKFFSYIQVLILSLYIFFILIWSTIGCIILFRDSSKCYDEAIFLWTTSLINLVTNFSYIIILACSISKILKDINEEF